jgi:hypothetical protein
MAGNQQAVVNTRLHNNARDLIKNTVNKFAVSLILESKIVAHEEGADEVQSNHVVRASVRINESGKKSKWSQIIAAVGGTLLGAFIQGFMSELSLTSLRPEWIAAYVLAGFVGILLMFWGILGRSR